MKILFFIHSLKSGGAERVLSLLANHWQSEGHEISIALNKDSVFYEIDKKIKIINAKIDQKSSINPLIANFKRIFKYKNIIQSENPDVVISFMTTMCITTTISARLSKKPILLSEHTNYLFLKSKLWRSLRRLIYPFSNGLAVLTEYDKLRYYYHNNVHIIENPLVLTHNHIKTSHENIILAVGRLHEVKGFDMLLKAYSLLENKKNWKLIILGEGPEEKTLKNLALKLNIPKNVIFPGVTSDVEKYYKAASIFVLSSRSEGFPVALCEAMAYGCSPIAFDCLTGPSDIINHQYNGLLVETENIQELSASIQDLINDKKKRELISHNALQISDRLNIESISGKWFKLIEKNSI